MAKIKKKSVTYVFFKNLSERQRVALLSLAALYGVNWAWFLSGIFHMTPAGDVPLHFLGGFFVGLFFLDVFKKALAAERGIARDVIIVVGATLVIGFLWEIQEYALDALLKDVLVSRGVTKCCIGSLADTLKDLVVDALGALGAFFTVRSKHKNSILFRD